MATRRRKSRFGLGLLIYILIFALLAAAALVVLHRFLTDYEETRVTTAVRRYLDACSEGNLSYGWGAALGRLDAGGTGEAQNREWARQLIRGATLREIIGSDREEKSYGLYDENGHCFETLTLRQSGEPDRWGFTGWQVTEENISLEPYTVTVELTVPSDYSVTVGGTPLTEENIAERSIPYAILEPFEDVLQNPPTQVRYRFGPVLGAGEVAVLDPAGRPVPEELQNEDHYLDNCTDADKARIRDFVDRYLAAYLPYADDLNRGGMAYFWDVYGLIIHGGELEERIRRAQDGFEYGNVQKLEILSTDISCSADLGGGLYFTDFSYHIRTYGLHDPTEEDYRMRLLLREVDGVLYAEQMMLS